MAKFDLKVYARQGAAARAAELRIELEQIYKAFPDLRTIAAGPLPARAVAPRSGRKPMSAAQRKAVAERMRRYWAERRKAKQLGRTK